MLETEVDFSEGLASWEQVLLGQVLKRNFVINSKPFESFDVLSSILEYVADYVRPTCLLAVVPLRLGVPVRRLRRLQLRVHLENDGGTVSLWILLSSLKLNRLL